MDASNNNKDGWKSFKRKAEDFFHAIKNKIKTVKAGDRLDAFSKKAGQQFKKLGQLKLVKSYQAQDEEKKVKMALTGAAAGLLCLAIYSQTLAYDIYIGEQRLTSIRKSEELQEALDNITKDLSTTYDMDIILDEEVKLKRVNRTAKNIVSGEELKKELKAKMNFLVQAYSLVIEDKEIGALKTKEEMESLLSSIKEPYKEQAGGKGQLEDVKLLERVLVKKEQMPLYKVTSEQSLKERLLYGGKDMRVHTVEVGETLWTIAKIYDMTMEELIEANSDRNPDNLQIGDQVKLLTSKPLLTVATEARLEYEEKIQYDIDIEYDDQMYDDQKKVKIAGQEGRAKIVSREVRHNGKLIKTEIVEKDIIKEPSRELLVKGTKEVPKTRATGTLAMATRGRISSGYGMRNGRMHRGLDIAASTGTAINASDGGKVTYSGYRGAYGYLVEIDHENGFKTRYAHCSKIHVKAGDRVFKGQHIANVGNTGRSTGPHLHIEVLKNGSHVNPSKYLK